MYRLFFKRLFDILVSLFVLIITFPIFAITIILLLYFNSGNVFFLHSRPGYRERIFTVIKFKTMNDRRDADGNLLPDKQRLTPIGKFIRSTSIDELPQLFNVLKGDMSLIGPRPLLIRYLPLYNEFQKRRHEVKPGITGWAQVNGRNAISWEEKFSFDVYYVDNLSWWLDMKIIALTIKKVFIREGINNKSAATMPEFKGTK